MTKLTIEDVPPPQPEHLRALPAFMSPGDWVLIPATELTNQVLFYVEEFTNHSMKVRWFDKSVLVPYEYSRGTMFAQGTRVLKEVKISVS